jgi:hypothetical protein
MKPVEQRSWQSYLWRPKQTTKTTWLFKIVILSLVLVAWVSSGDFVAGEIARTLSCTESAAISDAILTEDFDHSYLLYERARDLRAAGFATRVLVPAQADLRNRLRANRVTEGIIRVMAEAAHLPQPEVFPVSVVEPVSLNVARDVRKYLTEQRIRSMIVVTQRFRSRRSMLVHRAVLGQDGVLVYCAPVERSTDWRKSWHGIQEVSLQFIKLQYYRLYVLPFLVAGSGERK